MKKLYFLSLLFIFSKVHASYDTIVWKLNGSNAATVGSNLGIVVGANQTFGAGISGVNYVGSYQQVPKPPGGWPLAINTSSNNTYIEFPHRLVQDVCYDTFGYRICTGYGIYALNKLSFSGYVSSIADSVVFDAYFYDTSFYSAAFNGGNAFKYLGEAKVRSTDPLNPSSNALFMPPAVQVTGSGAFSSIRLYPKSGGDVYIQNLKIEGNSVVLLPLRFTYTSATMKQSSVEVKWRIENAGDARYFDIERSSNGRDFMNAGTVTSTGGSEYVWTDFDPSPAFKYYRVKAVEKDGNVIYSPVLGTSVGKVFTPFVIAPNPAEGKTIALHSNDVKPGKYSLELLDAVGRRMMITTLIITNGYGVNIIQLPSSTGHGWYNARIFGNNESYSLKILLR